MAPFNIDRENSQDEVVGRVAASAFSNVTDSIIDAHTAIKVLAITVTAEIGLFAMFYVSKDKVTEFLAEPENDSFWIYGSAAIFVIGFLTAFAVYRLVAKKWPHPSARVFIWLVSTGVGLLNVLLFFAFITFEMRP
ncbi:MAG TPA: hypothetical protein VJ781_09280 [Pyrinomonadaceae bacterium]|nr:hypothetical protein [Pyrinomonadaceae bacterium]